MAGNLSPSPTPAACPTRRPLDFIAASAGAFRRRYRPVVRRHREFRAWLFTPGVRRDIGRPGPRRAPRVAADHRRPEIGQNRENTPALPATVRLQRSRERPAGTPERPENAAGLLRSHRAPLPHPAWGSQGHWRCFPARLCRIGLRPRPGRSRHSPARPPSSRLRHARSLASPKRALRMAARPKIELLGTEIPRPPSRSAGVICDSRSPCLRGQGFPQLNPSSGQTLHRKTVPLPHLSPRRGAASKPMSRSAAIDPGSPGPRRKSGRMSGAPSGSASVPSRFRVAVAVRRCRSPHGPSSASAPVFHNEDVQRSVVSIPGAGRPWPSSTAPVALKNARYSGSKSGRRSPSSSGSKRRSPSSATCAQPRRRAASGAAFGRQRDAGGEIVDRVGPFDRQPQGERAGNAEKPGEPQPAFRPSSNMKIDRQLLRPHSKNAPSRHDLSPRGTIGAHEGFGGWSRPSAAVEPERAVERPWSAAVSENRRAERTSSSAESSSTITATGCSGTLGPGAGRSG